MRIAKSLISSLVCLALSQATLACASTATNASTATDLEIVDTGQGPLFLDAQAIHELSGITHLGGDDYMLVSDKRGKLVPASIAIDLKTGRINKATLGKPITLVGAKDLEDIAYDAKSESLFVVDEANHSVTRLDRTSKKKIGHIGLARLFHQARPNLGLESLAVAPDGLGFWTANEEALATDGPRADATTGTIIHLQYIDDQGQPAKPLAYLTDPHAGSDNVLKRAQSGVSGLVALPGGRLIVMERALGGHVIPSFRIRLYLVHTSMPDSGEAKPARLEKTLLLEIKAGPANYEGITLGPRLDNGDYSVLLVADDGGGSVNPQCLLALRLSGLEEQDNAGTGAASL